MYERMCSCLYECSDVKIFHQVAWRLQVRQASWLLNKFISSLVSLCDDPSNRPIVYRLMYPIV